MQHALIRAALHLLQSGVASAEDIDAAMRYSFGFRLAAAGPLLQREHATLTLRPAAPSPRPCGWRRPAPRHC